MSSHVKNVARFPGEVAKTRDLYSSLGEIASAPRETINELREFSTKVIYRETEGKNPYFLTKEVA